jgi:hypothetical protein
MRGTWYKPVSATAERAYGNFFVRGVVQKQAFFMVDG